jgi:hypothetical protein
MATIYSSFTDFIRKELSGECWQDVTYRAYDLEANTGLYTITRALRLLKRTEQEVKDDLIASGLPATEVKGRLARWCVWYRLSKGDLIRWPLREKAGSDT